MPEFGRLDYLTRVGWVVGHSGIALQDPARYVRRLGESRGLVARFVPGEPGGPYGEPVLSGEVPPFPEAPQGRIAVSKVTECAACGAAHATAWECVL